MFAQSGMSDLDRNPAGEPDRLLPIDLQDRLRRPWRHPPRRIPIGRPSRCGLIRLDVDLGALEMMLQFPRAWPASSGPRRNSWCCPATPNFAAYCQGIASNLPPGISCSLIKQPRILRLKENLVDILFKRKLLMD